MPGELDSFAMVVGTDGIQLISFKVFENRGDFFNFINRRDTVNFFNFFCWDTVSDKIVFANRRLSVPILLAAEKSAGAEYKWN